MNWHRANLIYGNEEKSRYRSYTFIPFFSGYFIIHTDAGNLQLGVVINHNRNTIDFYSRKLTPE